MGHCFKCRHFKPGKTALSRGACARFPLLVYPEFDKCKEHEPMKLKGIPVKNIRETKTGKIAKLDKAPAQVKQARRRKAGKVTGVRAAK